MAGFEEEGRACVHGFFPSKRVESFEQIALKFLLM